MGEAPGEKEDEQLRPFVGPSGEMLDAALLRAGLSREDCYVTNLCHYRPYGNKFETLIGSEQLKKGLEELESYVRNYKPTVILALGRYPLEYIAGKFGISAWRGSILPCVWDESIKVIATYHPAFVLRNRETYPIFGFDVSRAIGDSKFREFRYPEYEMVIDPRGHELEDCVQEIINADRVAVDIESVKESTHILCVGFAVNPHKAICIPNRLSPEYDRAISRIMQSPTKKIFHFGNFDTEVLLCNGFPTENYWWDTLTAQHILEPEMPRSLAYLTSIYTRMPYFKESGRSEIPDDQKAWGSKTDKHLLYEYNCRDVIATISVQLEQEKEIAALDTVQQELFRFEMEEIPIACEIGRNGTLFDLELREKFDKAILDRWSKLQNMLEVLAGGPINTKSTPGKRKLLYGTPEQGGLKLPPRTKKNKKGESILAVDEDAIVSLIGYVKDYLSTVKRDTTKQEWKRKLLILNAMLAITEIRQLRSNYVKSAISSDARMRSTYKVSNVDTGRWACEGYVDGTGFNAQTFARGSIDVPENLLEVDTSKLDLTDDEELEDAA